MWVPLSVALVTLGSLTLSLTWQMLTHVRLLRRPSPPSAGNLPPISILKPIKGVSAGLWDNLRAIALQSYPNFELVIGIQSPRDPAVQLVRTFMAEHPEVRILLHVGGPARGLNPKVNNLKNMLALAQHQYLLISDADVRPGPNYLRTIAREATAPGVGLVHSLLVSTGERRLGALLESVQMNTWVAAAVCGADQAGHSCVIGKSILLRRSVLELLGGFKRVQDVLAEDYLLGKLVRDAGYEVRLSTYPLPTACPDRRLAEFLNRHLRWAQMRRWIAPGTYFLELFANPICWLVLCVGLSLLMAPGALTNWPGELGALALLTVITKCVGDELVARQLRREGLGLAGLLLIPLKDLLVGALWVIGAARRTVAWRGTYMWIGPESSLHPLPGAQEADFLVEPHGWVDER
jgi:ceramide glucosyltransferase